MKHLLGSVSLFLLTWSSRRAVSSDTLPLGGNHLNNSTGEMVWSLLVNWEKHQVGCWRKLTALCKLSLQLKRRDSVGHFSPCRSSFKHLAGKASCYGLLSFSIWCCLHLFPFPACSFLFSALVPLGSFPFSLWISLVLLLVMFQEHLCLG